jgi:hypothetical protein
MINIIREWTYPIQIDIIKFKLDLSNLLIGDITFVNWRYHIQIGLVLYFDSTGEELVIKSI